MPTPEYYDVGEVVKATDDVDIDGVLTDPSTLTAKYRNPAGTITTKVWGTDAEVVQDGTGLFHIDIPATMRGEWAVRWVSTGTAAGATEYSFHVRTSRF